MKISKIKISKEEMIYLRALSENDPAVFKLLQYYEQSSKSGADKFISSLNVALAKLADKVEEVSDINFEDNTTHQAEAKYELLMKIAKDGVAISKTLFDIEKNKKAISKDEKPGDQDAAGEKDDDDDELDLEDNDELLDPGNPNHQRTIVDIEADKMRQEIKEKNGRE